MSGSTRKRRTSGEGGPGAKVTKTAALTDLKVPVDALLKSYIKDFDQWHYAEAGSLDATGGLILRPWMLNFAPEFGLRGYIEPVQSSALQKLQQFCTDPNKPGTEKIAVSAVKPEMLSTPPIPLDASAIHTCHGLLSPMSTFMVKGWSRCVAAVSLLLYSYESPEVLKVWESSNSFIEAYKIGQLEAKSAVNLLNFIPEKVVSRLSSLVRMWSMQKFMSHEPIANGVLNIGHVTKSPALEVWEPFLANTEEVLMLLLDWLEGDYTALTPKMRKSYKQSDIDASVAIFHLDGLRKKTPTSPAFPFKALHFRQVEPDLWGSFFAGQSKVENYSTLRVTSVALLRTMFLLPPRSVFLLWQGDIAALLLHVLGMCAGV
ncbi:FO synthase subunit 1 [Durusdinium trenchii]|uniref:FO synthase subunit 1 n=1 Tax=Durusdinium trenchii TaxID=1381693 RepID=A0ABP0RLD1_9DINO